MRRTFSPQNLLIAACLAAVLCALSTAHLWTVYRNPPSGSQVHASMRAPETPDWVALLDVGRFRVQCSWVIFVVLLGVAAIVGTRHRIVVAIAFGISGSLALLLPAWWNPESERALGPYVSGFFIGYDSFAQVVRPSWLIAAAWFASMGVLLGVGIRAVWLLHVRAPRPN